MSVWRKNFDICSCLARGVFIANSFNQTFEVQLKDVVFLVGAASKKPHILRSLRHFKRHVEQMGNRHDDIDRRHGNLNGELNIGVKEGLT